MKYYETLYIAHPILEMGRLQDLVQDVEKVLGKRKCELLYTDVWGKKRMSYPIAKQKFGTYVMIQFKTESDKNNEITFELEHNPNILRHMTILIDEADLKEQTEDIWDQISGLAKPHRREEKTESEEETTEKKDEKDVKLKETVEEVSTEMDDSVPEKTEQQKAATANDESDGNSPAEETQTETDPETETEPEEQPVEDSAEDKKEESE